jgi:hypothetical protein
MWTRIDQQLDDDGAREDEELKFEFEEMSYTEKMDHCKICGQEECKYERICEDRCKKCIDGNGFCVYKDKQNCW